MATGLSQDPPPAPALLILGAGALGRLWAGYLGSEGVGLVPRRPDRSGLCRYRLQTADGHVRPIEAPWHWPHPDHPPTLLLVTTKAQDTLPALADLLVEIPVSVPVVLFQNGMGSQQLVARTYPGRPILAASTTEGANCPDPDTVIHAGHGETWVGPLTAAGQACSSWVVERLKASGLELHEEADIQARLLRKVAVNAGINPFTALLDCRNGDILGRPFYRKHIDELCREIAKLMASLGLPQDPEALRNQIETVARRTADNTSSMLSDVRNRRPTEIDFINGWIADQCEARNLPAPVNRMLTERVKAISSTQ
ncbi:MAG: 2-dehydropantoate 2-reductase [Marinobacter sp.]|uniref:ketopantoate reductase family protein n=1 Tax=Marinobacter sp. TaxID=50741 RepID=UPI00299E1242|nr:2-dehydropantoate 2-reductase [Marinobacter sp.]MDX1635410.1 2-dehydropantoate 2-reductase [Marinobacter sp.]